MVWRAIDSSHTEIRPALRVHLDHHAQPGAGFPDRVARAAQRVNLGPLDVHPDQRRHEVELPAHVVDRDHFDVASDRRGRRVRRGDQAVHVGLGILEELGAARPVRDGDSEQLNLVRDGVVFEVPAGHGRALRRGLEREDPAVRPGTPGRQDRVDAQERPNVEYLVSLPDGGAQEFVQRRFAVVGDEVTKPRMDSARSRRAPPRAGRRGRRPRPTPGRTPAVRRRTASGCRGQ